MRGAWRGAQLVALGCGTEDQVRGGGQEQCLTMGERGGSIRLLSLSWMWAPASSICILMASICNLIAGPGEGGGSMAIALQAGLPR